MAAASPVDVVINPNNQAQRYVLWGNGQIGAYGGAPTVSGHPTWYDSLIPMPVAVALHITDWATPAGYVLDLFGAMHPFGGAPDLATESSYAGLPFTPHVRTYVDWAWKPDGSGHGYALDAWGRIWPFGGATPPPRSGPRWTQPFAKKLAVNWGTDLRAITLDAYGGLHPDFNGVVGTLSVYWPHKNNARDFAVTDWATGSGHVLDLFGGVHEFGTAPDTHGWPYRPGADVARALVVLSAADPQRFWQVWSGGQQYEYVSSTPPTVNAGGGTNEAQTVTITGSPTGGTFTLTYGGQTTAALAHNAGVPDVQNALTALSSIGPFTVIVIGGAGGPWAVTFVGALAGTDVSQMTATSSLTGGTSPVVTVATTVPGFDAHPRPTTTTTTRPVLAWTYSDPQSDSQAAWELLVFSQEFVDAHSISDPAAWAADALVAESGINPATRGISSPIDLPNGAYRMYVRAQDTAGQWSAWSNWGWTQNVPLPTAPTELTAAADLDTFSTALSVAATTGEAADLVRFEASDDDELTWAPVRGADAVPLAATTEATDWDIPLGVIRTYRAVAYAVDPAVASDPSPTDTATIGRRVHVLTAVDDPTLGGQVKVQEPLEWVRPVVAGVFQGLGADYPTVVRDSGGPKAARGTLHLMSLDAATWDVIEGLAKAGSTLVYRGPFGDVRYCELVGDWPQRQVRAAPTASEQTPLRHMHTTDLPLVEVRPPHLGT